MVKKIISILLLLIVGVTLFSGCSSKTDNNTKNEKIVDNVNIKTKKYAEQEFINCGKSNDSIYTNGAFGLTRGMKDLVQNDALECFGKALLSNDCKETSIEITHYFNMGEKSNYRYTIFNNDDICYIKGKYLNSTMPSMEKNKEEIIACRMNLSMRANEYEELDIPLDTVINTFTIDFLDNLHMHHLGVKSEFIEDDTCFIVK